MATSTSRKVPRILVAGLGNEILTDDGVGVHAARALRGRLPRGVRVAEVGTAVLDALHLLEWADAILALDAMQAGGAPGTMYTWDGEDARPGTTASLHELDILAALRLLPTPHTPRIAVLGIEPAVIDYGLDLSPRLQTALPDYVEAALRIVGEWHVEHHCPAMATASP